VLSMLFISYTGSFPTCFEAHLYLSSGFIIDSTEKPLVAAWFQSRPVYVSASPNPAAGGP
jgi:hypothetical protein